MARSDDLQKAPEIARMLLKIHGNAGSQPNEYRVSSSDVVIPVAIYQKKEKEGKLEIKNGPEKIAHDKKEKWKDPSGTWYLLFHYFVDPQKVKAFTIIYNDFVVSDSVRVEGGGITVNGKVYEETFLSAEIKKSVSGTGRGRTKAKRSQVIGQGEVVVFPPLLKFRAICSCGGTEHMLKDLHLLLRRLPKEKEKVGTLDEFLVCQTDALGFAHVVQWDSRTNSSKLAKKDKNWAMLLVSEAYAAHMVLHPDIEEAQRIIRADPKSFEAPWEVTPKLITNYRKNAKKAVDPNKGDEILDIDLATLQAKGCLPRGSDFLGGLNLYGFLKDGNKWKPRPMPTYECLPTIERLNGLKRCLGAMRYPIGERDDPYFERPDPNSRFVKRASFDWPTLSGVVRFQKDFEKKSAGLGIADKSFGDKLKEAAGGNNKKPGDRHLVPCPCGILSGGQFYLRDDILPAFRAWQKDVQEKGFAAGVVAGSGFRHVLALMAKEAGVQKNSVHKTGLAIDLCNRNYRPFPQDFPVTIIKESQSGQKATWRLYGQVSAAPDDQREYFVNGHIREWKFNEELMEGGWEESHYGTFVDISKLGQNKHGFTRISSAKGWMAAREAFSVNLGDNHSFFFDFLRKLMLDEGLQNRPKALIRLGEDVIDVNHMHLPFLSSWMRYNMDSFSGNFKNKKLLIDGALLSQYDTVTLENMIYFAPWVEYPGMTYTINVDNQVCLWDSTEEILCQTVKDLLFDVFLDKIGGIEIYPNLIVDGFDLINSQSTVKVSRPGNGRCREWWHFQWCASPERWGTLMHEIGYDEEILKAIGYKSKELEGKVIWTGKKLT